MTIIFICGSLEPGKDGVGDYARRFCAYLKKQNIAAGILSLNDRFITTVKEEQQHTDNESISCYRIPSNQSTSNRTRLAKEWIDIQNPQWLSLQFVLYAFNKKGLPFNLKKQLSVIGGNRKWHIMFHELWLGLKQGDPIKYSIIGFLQVWIVKGLLKKLTPNKVHTHTRFYEYHLRRLTLEPDYLPLFSNIPLIKKELNKSKLNSKNKSLVMFGSVHPDAPIIDFVEEVSRISEQNELYNCRFTFVGKSGVHIKDWIDELKKKNLEYEVLGELSEREISHILQDSDYAITTNPVFVVEKSGTVAAMREHGLPVLIVAKDTVPRVKKSFALPLGFFKYEKGNFKEFFKIKFNKIQMVDIDNISNIFINSLNLKK